MPTNSLIKLAACCRFSHLPKLRPCCGSVRLLMLMNLSLGSCSDRPKRMLSLPLSLSLSLSLHGIIFWSLISLLDACLPDEAVSLSSSDPVTELGNIAANFSYFHTRIMFNKDSSALESTRPIFLSFLSVSGHKTKPKAKAAAQPGL